MVSKSSREASALGHVDQIREIIVGDGFRQLEERLDQLDGRFEERLNALQAQMVKVQESRERALAKRIDRLKQKLDAEKAARAQAAKDTADALAGVARDLEGAQDSSADEVRASIGALENRLKKEMAALVKRIERGDSELSEAVVDRAVTLDRSKVDRTVLADLLEGLTVQLRGNGHS